MTGAYPLQYLGREDNIQVVQSCPPTICPQNDQVLVLHFNYAFQIRSVRHFCINRSIYSAGFASRLFIAQLFTRESSYFFQRVLYHRSSVRLSHGWISQKRCKLESPTSPSAAWKTLVSGIVKLFHKFGGGHPE